MKKLLKKLKKTCSYHIIESDNRLRQSVNDWCHLDQCCGMNSCKFGIGSLLRNHMMRNMMTNYSIRRTRELKKVGTMEIRIKQVKVILKLDDKLTAYHIIASFSLTQTMIWVIFINVLTLSRTSSGPDSFSVVTCYRTC